MRRDQRKTLLLQKAGLYILLTIFVCIIIFPFLVMLSTSLKSITEIRENPYGLIPQHYAFDNYPRALAAGKWPRYFANSAFITIVTTVIALLTNSIAGYAFARLKFRGRNILFQFSLVGMMIPMQVVLIPIFLKIKEIPLVGGNDLFGAGGSGLLNTPWGIIAPLLAGPFGVFLCRQFYMNFPTSLDEAARIDGCSSLRTYFNIYLPLSKPILATLTVLKATDTWNQYTWPLIITNSDDMRTVQLALAMFRGSEVIKWDLLMAMAVMICVPVLVLFLFLQKYYVQGIVTSGIKG